MVAATTKVPPAPVFKVSKKVRVTAMKALRPNEHFKVVGDDVIVTYYYK
jgi:hypothetical protein